MKRLPLVLDVAGMGLVAYAAFLVSMPVGFAVSGVSVFVLSWLMERGA